MEERKKRGGSSQCILDLKWVMVLGSDYSMITGVVVRLSKELVWRCIVRSGIRMLQLQTCWRQLVNSLSGSHLEQLMIGRLRPSKDKLLWAPYKKGKFNFCYLYFVLIFHTNNFFTWTFESCAFCLDCLYREDSYYENFEKILWCT